ncbi:unnamed protein product [Periconia digitata]|uniref:Uncharacterized protein n=1 Tax=Periconia digitata TaxID=1303443 RepID=A0A9W4XVT0_9PLEO|nr:unnamed protein product [Periconia digitata]
MDDNLDINHTYECTNNGNSATCSDYYVRETLKILEWAPANNRFKGLAMMIKDLTPEKQYYIYNECGPEVRQRFKAAWDNCKQFVKAHPDKYEDVNMPNLEMYDSKCAGPSPNVLNSPTRAQTAALLQSAPPWPSQPADSQSAPANQRKRKPEHEIDEQGRYSKSQLSHPRAPQQYPSYWPNVPFDLWPWETVHRIIKGGGQLPFSPKAHELNRSTPRSISVPWTAWKPRFNPMTKALNEGGVKYKFNSAKQEFDVRAPNHLIQGLPQNQRLGLCPGIYDVKERHSPCPYKGDIEQCIWDHKVPQEHIWFLYENGIVHWLVAANWITSHNANLPAEAKGVKLQYPPIQATGTGTITEVGAQLQQLAVVKNEVNFPPLQPPAKSPLQVSEVSKLTKSLSSRDNVTAKIQEDDASSIAQTNIRDQTLGDYHVSELPTIVDIPGTREKVTETATLPRKTSRSAVLQAAAPQTANTVSQIPAMADKPAQTPAVPRSFSITDEEYKLILGRRLTSLAMSMSPGTQESPNVGSSSSPQTACTDTPAVPNPGETSEVESALFSALAAALSSATRSPDKTAGLAAFSSKGG